MDATLPGFLNRQDAAGGGCGLRYLSSTSAVPLQREDVAPATAGIRARVVALPAWLVNLALLAVLLVMTLVPRMVALDRLSTPDEPLWLARSANFYQALASGNLDDTYQYVHPGVTVTWAGTLGYLWKYPDYADDAGKQVENRGSELPEILAAHGHSPLEMLVALRQVLTVFSALVLGAAFLFGIRLLGRPIAVIGFVFIALDPFHIALTRILHLDGLSTNLLLLTLLSFLTYVDQRRRRDLIISGIAAGLAWLTRSADLILGPLFALLVIIELVPLWPNRPALKRELWSWVKAGAVWTGLGVATFIALWPAMWVSPIGTLRKMVEGSLDLATEPHARQIFFAGKVFVDDPGLTFYPIVFVWRTTPVVLVGLFLALIVLLRPHTFGAGLPRRRLVQLGLFALVYILVLTAGAKKLDRYELPSQTALDLVAAIGWLAAARWLAGWLRHVASWHVQRIAQVAAPALLALAIGGQAVLAAGAYPYYFDYFNPLLGGAKGARDAMMVGWGEGMDLVADGLIRQVPDLDDLTIMVGPWPTSLSYFIDPDRVLKPDYDDPTSSDAIRHWVTTDLRVVTYPEVQRQLIPPELLAYYRSLPPVLVTQLDGQAYAWVYDLRHAPLPDYLIQSGQPMFDWGGTLRQVGSSLPNKPIAPGDEVRVVFYLEALSPLERPLTVDVQLLDSTGQVIGHEAKTITKPAQDRTVWPLIVTVPVPSSTAEGTYQIGAVVQDTATGQPLSVTQTATGTAVTGHAVIGAVDIGSSSGGGGDDAT